MPYYYTRITNHLSSIDNTTRPTFIIDKLSEYVFLNQTMAVSEWFASIGSTMENPGKIIQLLLLQPDRKDQLTQTDASYILHLCPKIAIEDWIHSIQQIDVEDWNDIHDTWLESFIQDTDSSDYEENDEHNYDSGDSTDSSDEEYDDDLSDYYSMPELEEDIVYERVVPSPWWNISDTTSIQA